MQSQWKTEKTFICVKSARSVFNIFNFAYFLLSNFKWVEFSEAQKAHICESDGNNRSEIGNFWNSCRKCDIVKQSMILLMFELERCKILANLLPKSASQRFYVERCTCCKQPKAQFARIYILVGKFSGKWA